MSRRPVPLLRPQPEERTGPALSVWACGSHTEKTMLRQGRYLSATTTDVDQMPPGVAAAAIAAFSQPGEVVCDPDCGAGTVLVEALWAGRHAVGCPRGHRWWCVARGNIAAAKRAGTLADGMVLAGHPAAWSGAHTAGIAGRVHLVLTALRPHSHDVSATDVAAAVTRAAAAITRVLSLLHPDGHVIITVPPTRHHDGTLPDTASSLLAATQALGLTPVGRCVAITAQLRGDRLITHAGLAERRTAHEAQGSGQPVCLAAHHDVWVFRPCANAHPVAHRRRAPMRLDIRPRRSAEPTGSTGRPDAGRRAA